MDFFPASHLPKLLVPHHNFPPHTFLPKSTKNHLQATMMEVAVADGKRHGFGLRVFANGSRYKGTWANDKMDGRRSQPDNIHSLIHP